MRKLPCSSSATVAPACVQRFIGLVVALPIIVEQIEIRIGITEIKAVVAVFEQEDQGNWRSVEPA